MLLSVSSRLALLDLQGGGASLLLRLRPPLVVLLSLPLRLLNLPCSLLHLDLPLRLRPPLAVLLSLPTARFLRRRTQRLCAARCRACITRCASASTSSRARTL